MTPLSLNCEHLPGCTVISVAGEVDASNSARLEAYIAEVRRQPHEPVVLDLAAMAFMDSSGLAAILGAHVYADRHGGSLHLAAVQGMPGRVLEITGVETWLNLHSSLEQAVVAAAPEADRARPRDTA
jgi:anti-sigma B factor antagonist